MWLDHCKRHQLTIIGNIRDLFNWTQNQMVELIRATLASRKYVRLFQRQQRLAVSDEIIQPRLVSLKRWTIGHSLQTSTDFSFRAELEFLGTSGHGIGQSNFPLVAAQKAISEAYERLIFGLAKRITNSDTSNGWAAHPNVRFAQANAAAELLERDAVMVQWLRQKPFMQIDTKTFTKVTEKNRQKFNLKAVLLSSEGHIPTITLLSQDLAGRTLIANGAGASLSIGFRRASVELSRLQKYAEKGLFNERAPSEIFIGAALHHSLHYIQESQFPAWPFGNLISFVEADADWSRRIKKLRPPAVNFQTVAEGDLYVVKCSSPALQPLYFGTTEAAQARGAINSNRIGSVNLNQQMHICL